ncbi:MAG: 2-amino-4-hydroxy-6-hydroxymethyldihydropteridine diphosphokinase [Planctomycetota bacterium]|nr:2-amino-4-hydroxy-6-hydroxymethyldihydropteridine diphosphokinase [Planctomycetota bacterium]
MGAVLCAIAVGSNLGDRATTIHEAIESLDGIDGIDVLTRSTLHETEPVGGPDQGAFLNGALLLRTSLPPRELLDQLHGVERAFGRIRPDPVRNGPRTLDLDLLLYGEEIVDDPDITIPHPRMHERSFVLDPLVEIGGDLLHPVRARTIRELHRSLDITELDATT